MKYTFLFMYMLWLINSSPYLQTTTQMTFWLSDAAWWQEIASSPLNVLLCGSGRLKELSMKRNCRNYSSTLNIAVQHWRGPNEGIYWIFLWENGFRKDLFFVTYYISHISFAFPTQDPISPLLPGFQEHRDFSQANSLSFSFHTEIFQVTHGIFRMGFSHVVPVKLQSKSRKSLDDFQNHWLDALMSLMISFNWVHQFPIQYTCF